VKGHAPENNDLAGQGRHATRPGPAGVSVLPGALVQAGDRHKLRALRRGSVADLYGGEVADASEGQGGTQSRPRKSTGRASVDAEKVSSPFEG